MCSCKPRLSVLLSAAVARAPGFLTLADDLLSGSGAGAGVDSASVADPEGDSKGVKVPSGFCLSRLSRLPPDLSASAAATTTEPLRGEAGKVSDLEAEGGRAMG